MCIVFVYEYTISLQQQKSYIPLKYKKASTIAFPIPSDTNKYKIYKKSQKIYWKQLLM